MPTAKTIDGAFGTARYLVEEKGKEPYYCCQEHLPARTLKRTWRELNPVECRELYGKRTCPKCLKNLNALKERNRSVCSGCYNNRYNYQSGGDAQNAPTSGAGCWHLDKIARGQCRQRR